MFTFRFPARRTDNSLRGENHTALCVVTKGGGGAGFFPARVLGASKTKDRKGFFLISGEFADQLETVTVRKDNEG